MRLFGGTELVLQLTLESAPASGTGVTDGTGSTGTGDSAGTAPSRGTGSTDCGAGSLRAKRKVEACKE